jgi:hypothetical protein
MVVSKRDRLQEFYRRLMEAPRAATFDEALGQLADILNAVGRRVGRGSQQSGELAQRRPDPSA